MATTAVATGPSVATTTAETVSICNARPDDHGATSADLMVSPHPTKFVAVENIPTFMSLPEALGLILEALVAAASAGSGGGLFRGGRRSRSADDCRRGLEDNVGPSPAAVATPSAAGPSASALAAAAAAAALARTTTSTTTTTTTTIEAVRIALSPSPSTYVVLLALSDAEGAAVLCNKFHLRRISTLAEERLVVRCIASEHAAAATVVMSTSSSLALSTSGGIPAGAGLSAFRLFPHYRDPSSRGGAGDGLSPKHDGTCGPSIAAAAGSPTSLLPPPHNGGGPSTTAAVAAGSLEETAQRLSPLDKQASSESLGNSPIAAGRPSPLHQPSRSTPQAGGGAAAGPCCSICLEPLGRSGAATIVLPCTHEFDLDCFWRVDEGVCPLCRFNVAEARAACSECPASGDLWLCLVCGKVACGRYGSRHAAAHFHAHPDHRYFMQVGGMRVWDMAHDTFVHRLIATADGRFVAAGGSGGDGDGANGGGSEGGPSTARVSWAELGMDSDDEDEALSLVNASAEAQSRLDAVANFYSELLDELLASQHRYFVLEIDNEHAQARNLCFAAEMDARRAITRSAVDELRAMADASLDALAGIVRTAKRSIAATKDRRELARTTVESLRSNVEKLRSMVAAQNAAGPSFHAAAAPSAAAADGDDREVARLEAQLQALYEQFA